TPAVQTCAPLAPQATSAAASAPPMPWASACAAMSTADARPSAESGTDACRSVVAVTQLAPTPTPHSVTHASAIAGELATPTSATATSAITFAAYTPRTLPRHARGHTIGAMPAPHARAT